MGWICFGLCAGWLLYREWRFYCLKCEWLETCAQTEYTLEQALQCMADQSEMIDAQHQRLVGESVMLAAYENALLRKGSTKKH